MIWTETTSQMIQDDSQSTVCETQPEKMENKRNFPSEEKTRYDLLYLLIKILILNMENDAWVKLV